MRTRFAPSPTGDLHLGSAFTALGAWWLARSAAGVAVLRVEDLDPPRVVGGAEARQREDLAWLGLDWDEEPGKEGAVGPYRQSERAAVYRAAVSALTAHGRTYPCDCSRAEIARSASAPHEGEEVAYPGTCRDKDPRRGMRRPPATRLRLDAADAVPWVDGVRGAMDPGLVEAAGDFVLQRGDGVYAYQLAVSVDDLAMGITAVVRGDDLLSSTPRQLLLMRLFRESGTLDWAAGRPLPDYWHLPLVRDATGARLAKRSPGSVLRDLRTAGVAPQAVVGQLAFGLGLAPSPTPQWPSDLARSPRASFRLPERPWRIPSSWTG